MNEISFFDILKRNVSVASEGFKRKRTAIFSADVAGYSHLIRDVRQPTNERRIEP